MQKLTLFFFLITNLILQSAAMGGSPFEEKFHTLKEEFLANATIGLVIQDLDSGKILFENRANENFYPASITKLLTASAALKFFGPQFQFQTSLHTHLEKLKEGVLEDNLYLIFRGDPSFTTEDLSTMVKHLKAKGINQIKGNIVIDDKAYSEPVYAPGWTWDSIPWSYSAPVTSIILNENKVKFKLSKPNALYELIKIEQENELPAFPLNAHVMAVTPEESKNVCQITAMTKNNQIHLSGCWPIDKTPTVVELSLDSPREFAKKMLQQYLQSNNVKLTGGITFGKTPKNTPAVFTKRSLPLKNLLTKVLAESNNIYTESLTKALGKGFGGQGTFLAGTIAIQEILKKDAHLDFSQVTLNDGSGQSRYNLISPAFVTKLLYHMHQDPNFDIFYASLSTGGKNGSLAERFKDKELMGKIVAKTGSAIGTSAISGYFTSQQGKKYVFSLLINQATQNTYALKSFEDKLCQLMIEEPWVQSNL